jgi:hypothetical protein
MRRLLTFVVLAAVLGCQGGQPAVEGRAQDLKIPNIKVGRGAPAGAFFDEDVWLAYTGTDDHLHTVEIFEDQFFDRKLPFVANAGPGMAAVGNDLVLAYGDSNRAFNAIKTSDGEHWTSITGNNANLPRIKYEPGLAVYFNVLSAFVVSFSSGHVVQLNFNPGSNDWTQVAEHPLESVASPSAAVLGNDLVLISQNPSGFVGVLKHTFGVGWGQPSEIRRLYKPHLVKRNKLPAAVLLLGSATSNIGSKQINFDESFNGFDVTYMGRVPDVTSYRPYGIFSDDSSVLFTYRGTNNGLYMRSAGLPAEGASLSP